MNPTVTATPAVCYTVRNDWAWAHIFIRSGMGQTGNGDPRGWVDVSVISDFGSFGYCWSHIGNRPWQEFLAEVDFHYAMQKMMGPRFTEHMSMDECAEKARRTVLQLRREDSLTKTDARELWDAIPDIDTEYPPQAFLSEWDRASSGAMYRNELWDMVWLKEAPQAVGFWAEIWPHFVASIQADRARQALSQASGEAA